MGRVVIFNPWGEEDARAGADRAYTHFLQNPPKVWNVSTRCSMCWHEDRRFLDYLVLSCRETLEEIAARVSPTYALDHVIRHRGHILKALGAALPEPKATTFDRIFPAASDIEKRLAWYRTRYFALESLYLEKDEDGNLQIKEGKDGFLIKVLTEARNCDVLAAKFNPNQGIKRAAGIDQSERKRLLEARQRRDKALKGETIDAEAKEVKNDDPNP